VTIGGAAVCAAAGLASDAWSQPRPSIRTSRGCYLVGQKVSIAGSGFAASRSFEVAVDGIDFGQSTTNAAGSFTASLIPGGLGANQAQYTHHLDATDGTTSADTTFTVTRPAGARFLASGGNPHTLQAPFEVWGFGTDGKRRALYLHYVSPSGRATRTAGLGTAAGQCGYLRTRRQRVFPFSPSLGTWTLQIDTSRRYAKRPAGAVARIKVQIH
jgi:hypothetical protein